MSNSVNTEKYIQLVWAFQCKSDGKKLLLLDLMSFALNAAFYVVRQRTHDCFVARKKGKLSEVSACDCV